jgi:hypothetical protein
MFAWDDNLGFAVRWNGIIIWLLLYMFWGDKNLGFAVNAGIGSYLAFAFNVLKGL